MTRRRAALAATTILATTVFALAQTQTLPAGLTRSGGVIMMQPISDTDDGTSVLSSTERRKGAIHVLSPSDHDLYLRAFDAGERGDWTAARNLADQGHDPVARRLIQWRYLLDRNSGAGFSEIDAFMKQNPDWPLGGVLQARAEAQIGLIGQPQSTQAILAWFAGRPPVSAIGEIRLGEALIAAGQVVRGRDLVRQGWINGSFDPPTELDIVQKDGAYLTRDVDRARLDDLLWRDDIASARRQIARVDDDTALVGEARIALRMGRAAAQKKVDAVPPSLADDPGLLFDRARAARRAGDNAQAYALLLRIANHDAARAYPAKWWSELNLDARDALQDGNARTAYALVANSGLQSGQPYAEAEFMAGWIALRFLSDPHAALAHFEKLDADVTRPISKARAQYWEGRAYEAMGDPDNAWHRFRLAADKPETFYGQLALARIDATPTLHVAEAGVVASPRADFDKEGLTRAMQVLADLGEEDLLRSFALHDLELHPSPAHAKTLAQALTEWGYREIAVRVAKTESYDGVTMLSYSHPVIPLPSYPASGPPPEAPFVLGLIRQETEFDPDSVSGAGARGMMQLMPSSARRSASIAHIAYRPNDLTSDPDYNIQLGMTELGDDLNQWSGSYVLAAAAYNAGNGNVQKWVNANGDPRLPGTDPVDWIEKIPFNETRNYVQRVLENTEIYRNRLAGRDQPLRTLIDLYRPVTAEVRIVPRPVEKPAESPPAAPTVVPLAKPVSD